jgi:hypothetical protein
MSGRTRRRPADLGPELRSAYHLIRVHEYAVGMVPGVAENPVVLEQPPIDDLRDSVYAPEGRDRADREPLEIPSDLLLRLSSAPDTSNLWSFAGS